MAKEIAITDDHYKAIGEVVVTWARLENHTVRALQALLQTDFNSALAVFWHMQYRERRNRLANLVYLRYTDKNNRVRQEFDTLIKRMDVAYGIRNEMAHSVWFRGKELKSIKPFIVQAKGTDLQYTGRSLRSVEYTAERIHKEAEKISRLAEDFKDFFSKHLKARFVHKAQNRLN
jgi:hypothetical protein